MTSHDWYNAWSVQFLCGVGLHLSAFIKSSLRKKQYLESLEKLLHLRWIVELRKYYNAIKVKNKCWSIRLEVFPTELNHIEILKYGDHYV